MSNMFATLADDDDVVSSGDSLGGNRGPLEAGIYTGKVKYAYQGKSKKGAGFFKFSVMIDGKEHTETLYITNSAGENYFTNKQTGEKTFMSSFEIADSIALFTTGKPLKKQTVRDKSILLYDYEQKQDVPTSVPMFTDIVGKDISLGILNQLVNKTEEQGDKWVALPETKVINKTDKVFEPETMMTANEVKKEMAEAVFYKNWLIRNEGKQQDKRTNKEGGDAASSDGDVKPTVGANTAGTPKLLFNRQKS